MSYNTPNTKLSNTLESEEAKRYIGLLQNELRYLVIKTIKQGKMPIKIDVDSCEYLKGGMSLKKMDKFDHKSWFFAKGNYQPVGVHPEGAYVNIEVQRGPNKQTNETENKITVKLRGFGELAEITCYHIVLD